MRDPAVDYLNHGAFGGCPIPLLEKQQDFRAQMEREPVDFFVRDLEELLDEARASLAEFLSADVADLVYTANATSGVNAVLRSLRFGPGDELLVTDQEYNASRNVLDFVAEQSGAAVVCANVPFPLRSADDVVGAVLGAVTPRTRLALLDHVTSQTGLVNPIARITPELRARGIDVLIDGAHAPGSIPIDLRTLGATFYTGNCHKWLCAPKGAAFLYVERSRQAEIRPTTISHGANSRRTDRSRFQIEFGWMGTRDLSAFLCVPAALRFMAGLLPGGWPEIMARNHALAVAGRKALCEALAIREPAPREMLAGLASVPLPDAPPEERGSLPLMLDPLQDRLRFQHQIEVPILPWPAAPARVLRVSAQLYNSLPQYERLAGILRREFAR
jgi:isopenicillin-N epimerase